MFCKKCGAYNSDDCTVCISCGEPISKPEGSGNGGVNQANTTSYSNDNGAVNLGKNTAGVNYNTYNQQNQNPYGQNQQTQNAYGYNQQNQNAYGYNQQNQYGYGQQNQNAYGYAQQNQVPYGYASQGRPLTESDLPAQLRPITMWGYIGYVLLFAIPFVGLIAALVFAFGNSANINVRNIARGYLMMILIGFVIAIFLAIFFPAVIHNWANMRYYHYDF